MQDVRYYDLRQVKGYTTHIDIDKGVIEAAGTSFFNETIIRVLGRRAWGVVSLESFDPDSKRALGDAIAKALTCSEVTSEEVTLAPVTHRRRRTPRLTENPADIDLDEKTELLMGIDQSARLPEVVNTRSTYLERRESVHFSDSSGYESSYVTTRCGYTVMAIASRQGIMQMGRESQHAITGFNLRHQVELGEKAGRTAVALLDAGAPRGGVMHAVLDQELAGVFAHEAVGHASEGDLVKEGTSVLKGRIGEVIGNESLTIVDDPSIPEFGFEPMDAEGSSVRRTEIISRGKVNSFLHSRETAAAIGHGVPGHARAMAGDVPLVRMSNTFIENGDATKEELIQECENGILLIGSRGGQVDPGRGIFLFNAEYGYRIERGECTTMVRDVSLSGEILKTLHEITLVGKDRLMHQGFCGKGGQSVPVSDGSPHLLLLNAVVGGSGTD